MSELIAFVLLLGATISAERVGRPHRPVAVAFTCLLVSAYAAKLDLHDVLVFASTVTPPAAIAAASWAALQSRFRPRFSLLLFGIVAAATIVALLADRMGHFGQVMAYVWIACALLGGAAQYRSEAPALTRAVIYVLVAGLPAEAVGWMGWRDGSDSSYHFARTINSATLALVTAIQVGEAAIWPGWLTRGALRISSWVRRRRPADPKEQATTTDSSG